MFLPRISITPLVVTLPYLSLILLKDLRRVVFPQPDGPMSEVIIPGLISTETLKSA